MVKPHGTLVMPHVTCFGRPPVQVPVRTAEVDRVEASPKKATPPINAAKSGPRPRPSAPATAAARPCGQQLVVFKPRAKLSRQASAVTEQVIRHAQCSLQSGGLHGAGSYIAYKIRALQ